MDHLRPTVFFGQKLQSRYYKNWDCNHCFFLFSSFPSPRSFSFSFPFPSCLLSFSVDVFVSAPPLLAFQLFTGQTIQLLYFCPKNEVVVVVVVCSFLWFWSFSNLRNLPFGDFFSEMTANFVRLVFEKSARYILGDYDVKEYLHRGNLLDNNSDMHDGNPLYK